MPKPTVPSAPAAVTDNAADIQHSGLKATLPRIKVLEVFHQSKQRHLSAEDVYKKLVTGGADIGLATVYRVLMQFEQAGLLSRTHFDGGKSLFEINEGQHHDHLVCLSCGQVVEFFDDEIEKRQREIADKHGFTLQDHALALYGVCSRAGCRGRKAAADS